MTLSRAFNVVVLLVPRPLSVFHLGQSVSDHVVRARKRSRLRHRNELIVRAWEEAVPGQGKHCYAINVGRGIFNN